MGMESQPLAALGSVFSREPIVGGRRCGEASSSAEKKVAEIGSAQALKNHKLIYYNT